MRSEKNNNLLLLSSMVLLPSPVFFSLMGNYFLQFFLFVLLSFIFFRKLNYKIEKNNIILIVLCVSPFLFTTILNLDSYEEGSVLIRELAKFIFIPLSYIVLLQLSKGGGFYIKEKDLFFFILTLLLCQFLIVIFQALPITQAFISFIYDSSKLTAGIEITSKIRYTGSFENPNYLGFFSCCTLAFILCLKEKIDKGFILLCSLAFTLVLLSGSRTSLLCSLSLLCIRFVKVTPFLFIPLIVIFGGGIYDFIENSTRLSVFSSWDALTTSHSFGTRYQLWFEAFEAFSVKPFFGYSFSPIGMTDNYFSIQLLRYGLYYWLVILLFIFLSRTIYRKIIYFLIIFIIFSMAGAFFDNFRLLFIFIFYIFLTKGSIERKYYES